MAISLDDDIGDIDPGYFDSLIDVSNGPNLFAAFLLTTNSPGVSMVGTLSNIPLPATIPPYIFPGILTVVPLKIVFPPLYFACSVNFGLAARIAETVVLLALAILDKVCPLLAVTVVDVVLVVPLPTTTAAPRSAPGPRQDLLLHHLRHRQWLKIRF